jgi:hypothetical protein
MNDNALRMAEAEAADEAMKRFLRPAFTVVRDEYINRLRAAALKDLSLGAFTNMTNLSVALKVMDEVQAQLEALIADGKVAADDAGRASRIAAMSPEAVKWARY